MKIKKIIDKKTEILRFPFFLLYLKMKTLGEIRNQYHKILSSKYSSSEIDIIFYSLAELYLHQSKSILKLSLNEPKEEADLKEILFASALFQLDQGKPYQYIIGFTEFFECEILVNSHVLIPRPETEELVEWALNDVKSKNKEISLIDICSGSGCIAIALAKYLPKSEVFALEINEKAIELSKKNATYNKVSVQFIKDDILIPDYSTITKKFDMIISNPPYIKESEKKGISLQVLDYEPHSALFVPDYDPLLFYQKIINFAKEKLEKSGSIYVEINQYLAKETYNLFDQYFLSVELKKDLSGNNRMIKAQKWK